jgi:dihydroxyacetone kinase
LFEEERGVAVERAFCGSFMTSLEMAGLSVTILHLDDTIKRCLGMYAQDISKQNLNWV